MKMKGLWFWHYCSYICARGGVVSLLPLDMLHFCQSYRFEIALCLFLRRNELLQRTDPSCCPQYLNSPTFQSVANQGVIVDPLRVCCLSTTSGNSLITSPSRCRSRKYNHPSRDLRDRANSRQGRLRLLQVANRNNAGKQSCDLQT